MKYAEQIMIDARRNQWFIIFHVDRPEWDSNLREQHMEWFRDNNVVATPVAGMGDLQIRNNIYHVDFVDAQDPRLLDYMNEWELSSGESRMPDQYQMAEWSYSQWQEIQGEADFLQWLNSVIV